MRSLIREWSLQKLGYIRSWLTSPLIRKIRYKTQMIMNDVSKTFHICSAYHER